MDRPDAPGPLPAHLSRELNGPRERVEEPRGRAPKGTLTIVYADRDRGHNNAAVLAELARHG
jgi:uncharacterized protein YeaO (DUF488 family)